MGNPPKSESKKKQYNSKKKMVKPKRSIIPTAPPNHTVVKLRYSENITLLSLLGANVSAIYRINDLYDPNFSGTGHQSYFRDQMFGLYSYGRVLWASIQITVISPVAQQMYQVVLAPVQSGSADSDISTASERKGSKEAYMNGQQIVKLKSSSSSDYYFGQAKGATLTQASMAQPAGASLVSSNSMWYEILMKTLNNATADLYIKVDIEQITRFEEPIQQTGS